MLKGGDLLGTCESCSGCIAFLLQCCLLVRESEMTSAVSQLRGSNAVSLQRFAALLRYHHAEAIQFAEELPCHVH